MNFVLCMMPFNFSMRVTPGYKKIGYMFCKSNWCHHIVTASLTHLCGGNFWFMTASGKRTCHLIIFRKEIEK